MGVKVSFEAALGNRRYGSQSDCEPYLLLPNAASKLTLTPIWT